MPGKADVVERPVSFTLAGCIGRGSAAACREGGRALLQSADEQALINALVSNDITTASQLVVKLSNAGQTSAVSDAFIKAAQQVRVCMRVTAVE